MPHKLPVQKGMECRIILCNHDTSGAQLDERVHPALKAFQCCSNTNVDVI